MALAEFMSDGSFARFLRRMRRIYAERHALLSEGLLRIAPDLLRPILSFSGLHLTTLLTEDIEESEMQNAPSPPMLACTHYRAWACPHDRRGFCSDSATFR